MSKASSLEQRAKKKLADVDVQLTRLHNQLNETKSMAIALTTTRDLLLHIIHGDEPESPVAPGPVMKPPSEGDAPRQRRRYTRKAKMIDPGATGDVPVVRAKAKEPKDQEASSLATHYCHDCASNVAVTVQTVKGQEQIRCHECDSLQVESSYLI